MCQRAAFPPLARPFDFFLNLRILSWPFHGIALLFGAIKRFFFFYTHRTFSCFNGYQPEGLASSPHMAYLKRFSKTPESLMGRRRQ